MTDRQQKFADEYIIDCNASRAYKAAYPGVKKDSVAGAAGARLLKNVRIKAYIEEKLAEISSQKTAKATEVMEYLTSVMRGEHTEEIPILCGDGCQELTEKAVGAKERLKAAELIGKRYGMFTDKVDVDGAVPVVITGGDALED
jgi:phage terminase small subunit|nr:MAG TPA: Terminase small subunit [Caudoviricetes sp.]DAZ82703.1 MAG TPA: Terminase small subunit [Caudoviricetes sp.]